MVLAAVAAGELGSVRAMTGERMTPEREAELREFATERPYVMSGILVEALAALADQRDLCEYLTVERDTAQRAAEEAIAQRDANLAEADAQFAAAQERAQQMEVPLSSALGFAVLARDDQGVALILEQSGHDDQLFVSVDAAKDEVKAWNDDPQLTVVAVVPVSMWPGADGRIGS